MKRTFSIIIAVSLILSMSANLAFADNVTSQPVSLWDKYLYWWTSPADGSTFNVGPDWLNIDLDVSGVVGHVTGLLSSNMCPNSDDNLHHAHHFTGEKGEDGHGKFAIASCTYCGNDFKVYGQDVHDAYDTYIHDNNLDNDTPLPPTTGPISYTGHWKSDCLYLVTGPVSNDVICYCKGSPFMTKDLDGSYLCFGLYMPNASWRINCQYLLDYYTYHNNNWYSLKPYIYEKKFAFYGYCPCSKTYADGLTPGITPIVTNNFSGNNDSQSSDFAKSFYSSLISEYYVFDSIDYPSNYVPSTITVNNNDYSVRNFNFLNRTFNVVDSNNHSITITYGDDNYTITDNANNTTNTYNYYITNNNTTNNNESGDSGGGSGDSGGGSGSGSSIDYTNILNQIKDLLSQILAAIGIENNTVSIPADDLPEAVDEEQEIPGFFSSIVSKFLWINDLYHVILHLFQDISNDSISAQAVSQGIIPISALSPDHSSGTDDPVPDNSVQESNSSVRGMTKSQYTAPAISFYFPDVEIYGFSFGGYQVMDFSWYAPYKSQVDAILSGFMLIGFLVWVFHRAPEIIRGGAATQSTLGKFESYNEGFVDPQARWWT